VRSQKKKESLLLFFFHSTTTENEETTTRHCLLFSIIREIKKERFRSLEKKGVSIPKMTGSSSAAPAAATAAADLEAVLDGERATQRSVWREEIFVVLSF